MRLAGGRYVLRAGVAAGAMGSVWRAERSDDGETVAVKVLTDPDQAVRFEIEARLLERLAHPRVVRVLDHFASDGDSYLVMELVDGEDLRAHVDRHGRPGLPVEDAVRAATEAAEALAYVHAQHVVHRDVKPQNLVIAPDRGVVLVDFGVAREGDATAWGTVIGTPAYMAPEMLAGGQVSPRADVYGLAATLWTLLTGRPPRPGETLALDAPGEVVAALRGGLALDPATRTPSAEAFAAALGADVDAGSGVSLARTVGRPQLPAGVLGAAARAVAGVLEATAVSLAFVDAATGELVYEAAWGAGAEQVVGMRLAPGVGVAGAVLTSGQPAAVPDCRADARFAARVAAATGYVPHTMVTVPLRGAGLPPGILQALDRRDGRPYTHADIEPAQHAAELVRLALGTPEGPTVLP
jgi:serine/threonine-protein kinase